MEIYRNGTYLGKGTGTATLGGVLERITLGNWNTSDSWFFGGDMYEFVLYSSALSQANRSYIEEYFNTKFNLYAPQILALSRASGATGGGNSLIVTGAGFRSGAKVTLDTTDCASTTFVSNTKVICDGTPAHAAGLVSVKVTTPPNSATVTLSGAFSYNDAVLDPSTIAGLQYWLRPDSSTYWADGQTVWFWTESSSNNFGIFNPNSATRPTFTNDGGKKVLRFTGAQSLTAETSLSSSPYTVFVVAKNSDGHPSGVSGTVFAMGPNGAYDNALRVANTSGDAIFGKYGTEETTFAGAWNNFASPFIFTASVLTTGSAQTARIFKNGTNLGTGTGTVTAGGVVLERITIGNWNTGDGFYFKGDYYEVLVYNQGLSDVNITNVLNYLNAKYSLY